MIGPTRPILFPGIGTTVDDFNLKESCRFNKQNMIPKIIDDKRIFAPTRPIAIYMGDVETPSREDDRLANEIDDEPAGHPEHAPEQADVVKPAVLPYVPSGQSRQEEAPASEYVPGGQNVQEVAPSGAHEPAAHDKGADTLGGGRIDPIVVQVEHVPLQAFDVRPAVLP